MWLLPLKSMYSFQASVGEATLTLGVNTPLVHHDVHNNIQETVLEPNLLTWHVCSWFVQVHFSVGAFVGFVHGECV